MATKIRQHQMPIKVNGATGPDWEIEKKNLNTSHIARRSKKRIFKPFHTWNEERRLHPYRSRKRCMPPYCLYFRKKKEGRGRQAAKNCRLHGSKTRDWVDQSLRTLTHDRTISEEIPASQLGRSKLCHLPSPLILDPEPWGLPFD